MTSRSVACRLAAWMCAVLAAGAVASWMYEATAAAGRWPASNTSDALPLYLVAQVVRGGGDPTRPEELAAVYDAGRLRVAADTFSTLYPASTAVILAPLVAPGWSAFAVAWRGVLLWAALLAGAMGAMSGVPRSRWPLAAALGAFATTVAFPITIECARIGQLNPVLAAGAAAAQWAASAGLEGAAVALLVLGGGLKLVPLAGTLPWFIARKGRALMAGTAVGLGVCAWTFWHVPAARVLAGISATLAYEAQASRLVVAGLPPNAPAWMTALVNGRHLPLALLTLVLVGLTAWRARDRVAVRVGGVALIFSWLAADAGAQHQLYLPLGLSALAWVITWPLAAGARWQSWIGAAALGVGLVLLGGWAPAPIAALYAPLQPSAEFAAVAFGELLWLGTAARLCAEAGPLTRRDWGVLGVAGALWFALAFGPPLGGPPPMGAPPPRHDGPAGGGTPGTPRAPMPPRAAP